MTIALLFITALVLAYANGANDNFKATATVYGSGALPYRASLGLATVAQITGSLASVLLAGALVKAFGGKGLVPDGTLADPAFIVSVGAGAAGAVLLATRMGLPVSTTHALIGGLSGAGLALAPSQIQWSVPGAKYFLPLLVSPLLATGVTALLYPAARSVRRRLGIEAETCLCVGESYEPVAVAGDGTMILKQSGLELSVSDRQECTRRYTGSVVGVSAQRVVDSIHTFSAFSLGFARGLNDTPKILALLVAASWAGLDLRLSLAALALAMMAGGLMHSRRLAQTLGRNITSMNRGQGLVANAVASSLVIGASLAGSPVSTTHVSTGAIFGISAWSGRRQNSLVGGIILAWIATLPIAAVLAWACAYAWSFLR